MISKICIWELASYVESNLIYKDQTWVLYVVFVSSNKVYSNDI